MSKRLYLLLLLFLFVMTMGHSQIYTKSQIDSLLENNYNLGDSIPLVAIARGQESYKSSERIGYDKGMVVSSILIAKNLFHTHQYDKALKQNLKVEHLALKINDFELLSEIYRLNGISYIGLGLFTQATLELQNSLNFTKKIADNDIALRQSGLLYTDIAMGYYRSGKTLDIVLKYFLLSYDCFSKMKESRSKSIYLSLANVNIGYCFLEMKQYKQATTYLTNAISLVEQENYNTVRLYAYLDLGRVNVEQNHFDVGIDYLEKAEFLAKKIKNNEILCDSYLSLFKTYKKLDDRNNEELYFDKYSSLNDSLQKAQKNSTLKAINEIIAQKDIEYYSIKKQWLVFLTIIIFITLPMVFLVVRIYKNKKIEKVKISEKRKELIEESQQLSKVTALKDAGLVKVVELAKKNDSQFLEAFKISHSDFFYRFIEHFPDLNESEIKVCAFLKLGFQVKDIAIYTDVTVRSVESRIYRIRKKTQLPIKQDISLWISRF